MAMTVMAASNLHVYQKANLSKMVEDFIKDSILRQQYCEGDRILEADLAEQLSISRGPVREAMKTLEQAGILSSEARKGCFITHFNQYDIEEVFEIRLLLEGSIFQDLLENKVLTDADFAALRKNVDDMIKIAGSTEDEAEKIWAINTKDIEFHRYLWARSGRKRKERMLNDLFFQLRVAMICDTKATMNLMRTATDHTTLIDNLLLGDLEQSKKALKDSIVAF